MGIRVFLTVVRAYTVYRTGGKVVSAPNDIICTAIMKLYIKIHIVFLRGT